MKKQILKIIYTRGFIMGFAFGTVYGAILLSVAYVTWRHYG